MMIWPVDQSNNLFGVENAVSQDLLDKICNTPWQELPWSRQESQELWARRRIDERHIPWANQWDDYISSQWSLIEQAIDRRLTKYQGTAWWLDEPGFTCSLHTDGEMPGSMHLFWMGSDPNLGTCFYDFKSPEHERHRFMLYPNCGYIMINQADSQRFRQLQWHGMLTPVPANSFRLTSYTWITPA